MLLSAALLGEDPVDVCYDALRLFACDSPEAVETLASALPEAAAWTLDGEARLVHFNAGAAEAGLEADANYGWSPAV